MLKIAVPVIVALGVYGVLNESDAVQNQPTFAAIPASGQYAIQGAAALIAGFIVAKVMG